MHLNFDLYETTYTQISSHLRGQHLISMHMPLPDVAAAQAAVSYSRFANASLDRTFHSDGPSLQSVAHDMMRTEFVEHCDFDTHFAAL